MRALKRVSLSLAWGRGKGDAVFFRAGSGKTTPSPAFHDHFGNTATSPSEHGDFCIQVPGHAHEKGPLAADGVRRAARAAHRLAVVDVRQVEPVLAELREGHGHGVDDKPGSDRQAADDVARFGLHRGWSRGSRPVPLAELLACFE